VNVARIRAEVDVVLNRPAMLGLLAATFVVCTLDAARPATHAPFGVLGSLLLSTDSNLTYGLAAALFVGIGVGSSYSLLGEIWHTHGVGTGSRTTAAIATAMLGAIGCRIAVVAGMMVGGAIDGIRRQFRWGSLVPESTSAILRGQLRVTACYLVAAALGCLLALAIRHAVATTVIGVCLTLPYIPLIGALANRAPRILGALPWAPFGALRGLVSGNGAIFGDDPSLFRAIAAATAASVLAGWLTVLVVAAFRTPGAFGRERERIQAALLLAAAVACAAVVGGVLPRAIGGSIPWQWRPSWRDASAQGWDSRQVAVRWAETVHDQPGSPVNEFFASRRAQAAVSPDVLEAVRAGSAFTPEPMSRMRGPGQDSLEFAIVPSLRSGNVIVDGAGLQLGFRLVSGHWLIDSVSGPFIHAGTRPP
jgi:hypothetical protein